MSLSVFHAQQSEFCIYDEIESIKLIIQIHVIRILVSQQILLRFFQKRSSGCSFWPFSGTTSAPVGFGPDKCLYYCCRGGSGQCSGPMRAAEQLYYCWGGEVISIIAMIDSVMLSFFQHKFWNSRDPSFPLRSCTKQVTQKKIFFL